MSDKDTTAAAGGEQQQEQEFDQIAWTSLLGVRAGTTVATARSLELRWVLSPVAMLPDGKGGHKPNLDDPAVHFADWFERHKHDIVNLWSEAYAQRMNIVRMTEGKAGRPPELGLVDVSGQRLSTDTTQ